MPTSPSPDQLARRERQIMDILFRFGRATAAEVQAALGEPVSNSAVRGMLRLLAGKGHVAYEQDGPRYVYFPTARPDEVSRSALRHLIDTFFRSSPSSAVAAMLDMSEPLTEPEYTRLSQLLEQARSREK
jgi:BlaI family transcriptional regulator, penicillinase repressor